jgi:hypothetical protein
MKRTISSWLTVLLIPVFYAGFTHILFNFYLLNQFTSVMSVGFLAGVPLAMGYLTVALSDRQTANNIWYSLFAPWVPILAFMGLTILFKTEGRACWIMILPVFFFFSSIGGIIARIVRRSQRDGSQKIQGAVVLFLPLLLSPLEKLLPDRPVRYEAYTCRDIRASPADIWSHVVRVSTIREEEDHGYLTRFLGFPRPLRAELNFTGVGGSRQAIFSKGLIFEEIVKEYNERRKMHFTIKADPNAIPPTAMDKHVVIGGQYFNVLDGTYMLETLNDSVCRLHLYSHFTLRTSFNVYAGWWAGLIMKDIQNNILRVIKTRCEAKL